MSAISKTTWVEWKRKRRHTTIGYILFGTIIGMDYSIILSTLYFYLKDVIKPPHPEFYYGLIVCIYCVSSSLFGVISSRIVDRTRRMVLYVNIITVVQIIGSLLYVIPFSVVYTLLARFLIGIGDAFGDVCTGEIVRIYNDKQGTRILYWISSAYTVGFIIGPAINILYLHIDFYLLGIHVNYLNFGGIFMAILLILALISNNILIHDCSAIIDYKEYLQQKNSSPGGSLGDGSLGNGSLGNGSLGNDSVDGYVNKTYDMSGDIKVITRNEGIFSDILLEGSDVDIKAISQREVDIFSKKSAVYINDINEKSDIQDSSNDETPDLSRENSRESSNENSSSRSSSSPTESLEIGDEQYQHSLHTNDVNDKEINKTSKKRRTKNKKRVTIPLKSVLKVLFTNVDSAIILSSGFILTYCMFATDVLLPLIINNVFKWEAKVVMHVYLAYGILSLIMLVVMSKVCTSGRRIYYLSVVCIVCVVLQFAVTVGIKWTRRSETNDIALLSLLLLFSVFGWCLLDVLLRSLMSKLVPSCIQSFTEVFRNMIARVSVITASLTGPFLLPWLHWWGLITIAIMVAILFCFLWRRKKLIAIEVIDVFQKRVDDKRKRNNEVASS